MSLITGSLLQYIKTRQAFNNTLNGIKGDVKILSAEMLLLPWAEKPQKTASKAVFLSLTDQS